MEHPSPAVRFNAIDAVLGCASLGVDEALAQAIGHIADQDARVRWKVMMLLSALPADTVAHAVDHVGETEHRDYVTRLIGPWRTPEAMNEIGAAFDSPSDVGQRFAAVAYFRLGDVGVRGLERAQASALEEVRLFADLQMDLRAMGAARVP
jgi:hypothetical protein